MVENSQSKRTVFICYAHESDQFRLSVKELADWLKERGCDVTTDHPYLYRPPVEGWQSWMENSIQSADVVLVVCTPKLKDRYEKSAPVTSGHGGMFEGAIVTQHIYDNAMRSDKVFPILPDSGSEGDIPVVLRAWSNGHRFPSGNLRILGLVLNGLPAVLNEFTPAEHRVSSSDGSPLCAHRFLATCKLDASGAYVFLRELLHELREDFLQQARSLRSARSVVEWIAQHPLSGDIRTAAIEVENIFHAVRRALNNVDESGDVVSKSGARAAAIPLFCLAACRLVNAAELTGVSSSHSLVCVPDQRSLICAVITTALFGGELHIIRGERVLASQYVFQVKVQGGGDQVTEDFERAVYLELFKNKESDASLDAGPLSPQMRADLQVRIKAIKKVYRRSFAIVIDPNATQPGEAFAREFAAPVLMLELSSRILGMSSDLLMGHFNEFWKQVESHSKAANEERSATTQDNSAKRSRTVKSETPPNIDAVTS